MKNGRKKVKFKENIIKGNSRQVLRNKRVYKRTKAKGVKTTL